MSQAFTTLADITNDRQAAKISDVATPHTLRLKHTDTREWFTTSVDGELWTVGLNNGAKYLCRCLSGERLKAGANGACVTVCRDTRTIPGSIQNPPSRLKPAATDGGDDGGYTDRRGPGYGEIDWFNTQGGDE
jgi:hypothetical protein